MRGVFVTGLLDIEDSSLIVIIHRVGVLVQPGLIRVHRGRGRGVALVMDNMMGLDIVGWLDVVGMSHMVSSVMTKRNNVIRSMMDRDMNIMMDGSRYGVMDCVMDRSRDSMMDSVMDSVMDCVMDRSRDSMMDRNMNIMMDRSRDGVDGVMDGGGGYWLIVHRSQGGGAAIQSRVNYWHCMCWFIQRWGHHCMGLLTYVLVDRGWLGFCYIRTGLRMMDAVMDRWLTGIFCRGRMTISMMGGGGVVAVLGVVDSGLYGGGMASLYHLVTDLETLDLGLIRDQHSHQEEMHTD